MNKMQTHSLLLNKNQIKIYGVKKILKTDKTNNDDDDQKQCPISRERER